VVTIHHCQQPRKESTHMHTHMRTHTWPHTHTHSHTHTHTEANRIQSVLFLHIQSCVLILLKWGSVCRATSGILCMAGMVHISTVCVCVFECVCLCRCH